MVRAFPVYPSARALLCLSASILATATSPANAEETQIAAVRQEVIVTPSPIIGDPDRLATITTRVDRSQIIQRGGANLADALRNVPGVTGTGFASGASRPVIRGFDTNRVRLLENGVGSFDVSDVGPDHGVPIDPLSAQAIEVVRGAATLRYGSQAIGGVVNAINNRIPLTLPEKSIGGEVTGAAGSNGESQQISGLFDARFGQVALHGDAFGREVNDYEIPDGTLPNSFFKGDGYSGGASYFFGPENKSRIGAAFIHYDAEYGIPNEESFIDMHQDKGLFGASFAVGLGPLETVTVDAGYADYDHREIVPEEGAASTFVDKEWDTRAEGIFGALGPFSAAAAGVQIQNRKFSALGEGEDYLLPTRTRTVAGFLFTESTLSRTLAVQLGARVENVRVEGTPISDVFTALDFMPVSGSVGLVYEATEALKFGLTVSSAARAPSQTELFARGPHESTQTFEVGDPAFGIERANSIEGTMRVRTDRVHVDGSAWAAKFHDYIFGDLTGGTCDEDGMCLPDDSLELRQLIYGQRDATFWGLEAKSTIALFTVKSGGTLGLDILADYVRATFDGGENVPRIPPYHVGGGLSWASDRVDAGFLLIYAGEQNRFGTGDTPTDGYITLDSQIAVRPIKTAPGFELALVGQNLTNETRRNAVSLNKDEVVLPGRDVRLVVRVAL